MPKDRVQVLAGEHGAALRHHPERAEETGRNLKCAKLERAIREAVASAPPLSAAQRDRLASLLTGAAR
ncbi:hypothetical protein [Cellulosimicrobium sp. KWT-B]|uniref:hypothetical protein n=1 Tax=Cellulosimicrobium sp. KWT-B TaxID=1981152 RepID=UPI00117871DC|nr:hypothetical protein [Cellulosimicrobium sp. KWT-B]